MGTTNVNFRLDKQTKKEAEELFEDLGLNMTTALTMFVKASIREQGIPFEVRRDVPNAETIAAIEESERLLKDPNVKVYDNMKDLIKSLESWNIKSYILVNLKKI